jgi:hypothetical protein
MPDRVIYTSQTVPDGYKCADCGATNCKLWREYQIMTLKLLCAVCACKDQKKTDDVDAEGRRSSDHGGRTDQIGWYVPAVPDEEGVGYWGYTSVPEAGVNWWRKLPTRPPASLDAAPPV